MKKRINLIVISFIISTTALCQSHFLSITEQKIDLSNNSYNVTKVIDKRSNKSNVGWTQKGMMSVKVNASFTNPVEEEVKSFLEANLNSDGPSIQIIIRTLKISEKTGFSRERGFCELSVDFLLEKESSVYRVLQTSQTTEVVSGMDVTKKHPKNIANAFKLCFNELSGIDLSNTDSFLVVSSNGESINEIPDSIKYDYPIFRDKTKTGIYASYDELKNNSPSNTEIFFVEKEPRRNEPWIGTYNIIPRFQETSKKVKQIWGIAHEGQIYVYHQKEFFPLIIKDYELYFYGYGIPSSEAVSTGVFIGGLIGAGIASGIENSNAKKQKVKYFLDPNTGGFGKSILEQDVK